MERCGICGAPLLRAGTTADGWALRCLRGCGALPLEALEDEPARKAAEQAAAGLGWYALADADDAAMDRAEACFHKAEQTAPGDVALLWAQLMCRFGLRWEVDGRDAALLLRRMRLTQRRLSEDSDFIRLQDAVAGTDALAWFETEARRVDQLLARAQAMQAEEGFDVFLALKCEENGVATAEKRFSDALYDQLVGVYSIRRVFYAPKTLSGRTVVAEVA